MKLETNLVMIVVMIFEVFKRFQNPLWKLTLQVSLCG